MASSTGFRIITEHNIRPGQLEKFKAVIESAVEELKANEPRTREYLVHITTDGSRVQFVQWYEDNAAFRHHLSTSGPMLGERLDGLSDFVGSWIYADQVEQETFDLIGPVAGVVAGSAFAGYRRD